MHNYLTKYFSNYAFVVDLKWNLYVQKFMPSEPTLNKGLQYTQDSKTSDFNEKLCRPEILHQEPTYLRKYFNSFVVALAEVCFLPEDVPATLGWTIKSVTQKEIRS